MENVIVYLRKHHHLTTEMMAEKLNVKFHTMVDLLIQESEIDINILHRCAEAFNMNLGTLIVLERIFRDFRHHKEGCY